jgi:hypothetical protein
MRIARRIRLGRSAVAAEQSHGLLRGAGAGKELRSSILSCSGGHRVLKARLMTRRVADYLSAAREFERLALLEPRREARELMEQQAKICFRLALKRAKEINQTNPVTPSFSA